MSAIIQNASFVCSSELPVPGWIHESGEHGQTKPYNPSIQIFFEQARSVSAPATSHYAEELKTYFLYYSFFIPDYSAMGTNESDLMRSTFS
jgi:hypothetical protein